MPAMSASRVTREMTADEYLGVLGDRVTRKLPSMTEVAEVRLPAVVSGRRSGTRNRRTRTYAFKPLPHDLISQAPSPLQIARPSFMTGLVTSCVLTLVTRWAVR